MKVDKTGASLLLRKKLKSYISVLYSDSKTNKFLKDLCNSVYTKLCLQCTLLLGERVNVYERIKGNS